jgi:hypothetical protein
MRSHGRLVQSSIALQDADAAYTALSALQREHGEHKARADARVLHLEAALATAKAESKAEVEAWRDRAKAAEATAGTCRRCPQCVRIAQLSPTL